MVSRALFVLAAATSGTGAFFPSWGKVGNQNIGGDIELDDRSVTHSRTDGVQPMIRGSRFTSYLRDLEGSSGFKSPRRFAIAGLTLMEAIYETLIAKLTSENHPKAAEKPKVVMNIEMQDFGALGKKPVELEESNADLSTLADEEFEIIDNVETASEDTDSIPQKDQAPSYGQRMGKMAYDGAERVASGFSYALNKALGLFSKPEAASTKSDSQLHESVGGIDLVGIRRQHAESELADKDDDELNRGFVVYEDDEAEDFDVDNVVPELANEDEDLLNRGFLMFEEDEADDFDTDNILGRVAEVGKKEIDVKYRKGISLSIIPELEESEEVTSEPHSKAAEKPKVEMNVEIQDFGAFGKKPVESEESNGDLSTLADEDFEIIDNVETASEDTDSVPQKDQAPSYGQQIGHMAYGSAKRVASGFNYAWNGVRGLFFNPKSASSKSDSEPEEVNREYKFQDEDDQNDAIELKHPTFHDGSEEFNNALQKYEELNKAYSQQNSNLWKAMGRLSYADQKDVDAEYIKRGLPSEDGDLNIPDEHLAEEQFAQMNEMSDQSGN